MLYFTLFILGWVLGSLTVGLYIGQKLKLLREQMEYQDELRREGGIADG